MKRFWPYWLFPTLHFAVVATAAFAVHYANGINIKDFSGDFGFWMDVGNLGISIFQFTRWIVPIVLFFAFLRAKEKKVEGISFVTVATGILIFTWPFYSGLIDFWQRNWISE
ncbi:MAG TPA: hypothetical protein VN048_01045 [Verrucomicrobiae bacterium]|jgi:hypothetical protein|nr:hypothetical protein [Verrucomicrobiae bacterium]